MNVAFLASEKPREQDLARAFMSGLGGSGEIITQVRPGFDAIGMVGVKSLMQWQAAIDTGAMPIMFDKGYSRHKIGSVWEYWRVAVGAHHPTRYLMDVARSSDRFDRLGLKVAPWKERPGSVVIAGSSEKCHRFKGLPHPTQWARRIVREIRRRTDAPIIYRPKPSWHEAQPLPGTIYGLPGSLANILAGAAVLVTHSSNACLEAILAGVPVVVLGDAAARPIAATTLDKLTNPPRPDRTQWLANLAYCQWTLTEFASGEAWETIRGQM